MDDMRAILKELSKHDGFYMTNEQIEKFCLYAELLVKRNKEFNLTAIVDPKEIALKHFLDSVSPLTKREFAISASVIDVGSGAGFPGIPMKIMRDDLDVCLLDSSNKRAGFLKEVCETLDLQTVRIVTARAEDAAHGADFRERFDFCVTRALARLRVLLELCAPFVKVGGEVMALKGKNVQSELIECQNSAAQLGLSSAKIERVILPDRDLSHNIAIFIKEKKTKNTYPRPFSNIKKSPL